jgi:PAS domain S-box-containing protein
MNKSKNFPGTNVRTITIWILSFCLLISAGVYYYYNYELGIARDSYYLNLKTVSELKSEGFTSWLKERKAEIEFFANDITFAINTEKARTNTGGMQDYFLKTLRTTRNNHHYEDMMIIDSNGKVLFSFDKNYSPGPETQNYVRDIFKNNIPARRDFYYCTRHHEVHFDIAAPIIRGGKTIAAILFRVNPENNLFRMIQTWPLSGRTGESFLIKREDDSVVFISNLRFRKNVSERIKISFKDKEDITVKAALGAKGITSGTDYKGDRVLANIIKIPETQWILISKTDTAEVYDAVWKRSMLVSGLGIVFILFMGIVLAILSRRETEIDRQKILIKEHDLADTQNKYRTMLYSIGDAVITTNARGLVQHMNAEAEKLTGWQENTAAGRGLDNVFSLINERDNSHIKNIFDQILVKGNSDSIFSEPVLLISKDGKRIPISDSGSQVKDENGKIFGAVIVFRDQTKTRETEKLIRESEQKYKSVFSNNHTVMLLIEPATGKIIDANPAACKFYGYSYEQLTHMEVFRLNQLNLQEIKQRMKETKKENGKKFNFTHTLANGENRFVEVYSTPVKFGNKEYLFSIVHDVTDQKIAEENLIFSEEKFSKAFKTSPDAITINRMADGLFYEVNEGFTEIYGYTWEEVKEESTLTLNIWLSPEERSNFVKRLRRDGEVRNMEVSFRRKDGEIRQAILSAKGMMIKGEECLLTSTRDVTIQKKALEALKASEEKFSKAFKTSPDGLAISRVSDGLFFEINDGFTDLLGYDWEYMKGKTSLELGIWNSPEDRKKYIDTLLRDGEVKNMEFIFNCKDKTQREILISAKQFKLNGEDCLISIILDITERKKAEKALRASEDKFSKAFKTSPDSISINRISDGKYIEIGGSFTSTTGYTWNDVKEKTSNDISIWANDEVRHKFVSELESKGEVKNLEARFRLKNGAYRTGLISAKIITINNEDCLITITRDITERIKAEQALKESEEHLKAVTENISDGLIITNSNGDFIYWNKAAFKIYELDETTAYSEIKNKLRAKFEYIDDDGKSLTSGQEPLYRIMLGEQLDNLELSLKFKGSKHLKTLTYKGTSVYLSGGEKLSFVFITDITKEKKAEQEARAIEKLLNLTGEMAKVGGWEFDTETLQGTWTEEVARIHDLVPGEPTNAQLGLSFYPDEDRRKIEKSIKDAIAFKQTYDLELELVTHKGNRKSVRTMGFPVIEGGKVIKLRGIFQDITERKLAEAAIYESALKLKLFVDHTPAAIAMLDNDMRYIAVSRRWYSDYQLSQDDIVGMCHYDVFPEIGNRWKEIHNRCLAGAVEKCEEDSFLRSDGRTDWVRWEVRPWYSHTNKIGGLIIFSEVITESITAKQTLLEKTKLEEQIAKIAVTAPGGLTSMRMYPDGRITIPYASPIWEEIYGLKADDVKENATPAMKRVFPADRERVVNLLNEAKAELKTWHDEFRIENPKKGVIWVEGHSTPVLQDDGSVLWHGFITDITQRKMAEQAFLEKTRLEEQIAKIAVTAPGGIYSLKKNPDGKLTFLYVSPLVEEIHGVSSEEILKDSNALFDRVHPEDREKLFRTMEHSFNTLTDWYSDFRIINPKKGLLWAEGHASPQPQPDGSVLWHGFITDITNKREAEHALLESQEQLRLVVENSDDIYIMQNIDGTYLHISASKKTGLIPEEIVGKKPDDIFNADFAARVNNRNKRVIELGEQISEDDCIDWREPPIWINIKAAPIKDINGKIISISTVVRNVTQQHLAEENIRKLSMGIEQSPVIIVITDRNGIIEYTNPIFTRITGYTQEEVIGLTPRILKSGHTPVEQYHDLWKTINAKNVWRGEFLNKKKNGDLYWESAVISPLLNANGEITNFIALKEDITELKRINDELIEAKEKAEEMNRLKSYFFANISHELRTPFVGIIGFSELLSERLKEPNEQKMAEAILTSSKRLTDTLNKILDISKLEFDKMELYPVEVNISDLIDNMANLFSKSASKKNTAISTDLISVPHTWNTDERMLREILNNLISNAVKFTSEGEIKITVSLSGEEQLVIKVSDTGVGIPEEKQDIIWQEFRQASEGYSRSFEGTGLGLSITKKYTQLLGGKIEMTSIPGKGTEFIVTIPEADNIPAPEITENKDIIEQADDQHPHLSHHKILYVEDDFISIEFVKEVLQGNYTVDIADRPQIALNMVKENFYDAILLDINLGGRGMNGIELLHEIKSMQDYKSIPVVAVTAYASANDRHEFLSRGFTHYLSKPFLSRNLTELLEEIFSKQA